MASAKRQSSGTEDESEGCYTCTYCKSKFSSQRECSSHRRREHHSQIREKRLNESGKIKKSQGQSSTPVTVQKLKSALSLSTPRATRGLKMTTRKIERINVIDSGSDDSNCTVTSTNSPFGNFKESKKTETLSAPQSLQSQKQDASSTTLKPACLKDKKSPKLLQKTKKRTRNPVIVIPGHIQVQETPQGKTLYECTVCKKRFKTKANVNYHEFCLNPDQRPLTCGECGKKFSSRNHLEYHLFIHTGECPFKCPESGCEAAFSQKGKLNRHMLKHTGERRYSCSVCHKKFFTTHSLNQHMLIHTGERPFACPHCVKRFTGLTNLKKHIITHTGEKPWTCSICDKSFGLKWSLDEHLRTHNGLRTYLCTVCDRSFLYKKDLDRHSLAHTGERPFRCPECNTAFRRQDNMNRHLKKVHGPKTLDSKPLEIEDGSQTPKANDSNNGDSIINEKAKSLSNSL